ncbi:hypothetical protein MBLNU459_g2897t1 [Dothideomycetes sp. NU459]
MWLMFHAKTCHLRRITCQRARVAAGPVTQPPSHDAFLWFWTAWPSFHHHFTAFDCTCAMACSSSSNSEAPTNKTKDAPSPAAQPSPSSPPKEKKTVAELDEELRQKMAGMSGDGGESGVEYEDGQPVSMKRGVKNNMFRYI